MAKEGTLIELKMRTPREGGSSSLLEDEEEGGATRTDFFTSGDVAGDNLYEIDDTNTAGDDLLREFDSKRKRNVAEPYYYKNQRKVVIAVLAGLGVILIVLLSVMVGYRMGAPACCGSDNSEDVRKALKPMAKGVLSAMDRQVDPCENFYQYSCGTWLRTTELPADKSRYSRSLSPMTDNNQLIIRAILEDDWPLISTFYRACMDNETLNQLGHSPLDNSLKMILAIKDIESFFKTLADLHIDGLSALFYFSSTPNPNDPTINVGVLGQAGLGLPDRDYYLRVDNSSETLRQAYINHMDNLFRLLSNDLQPPSGSERIFQVEKKLAEVFVPRTDLRDPYKTNNMKTLEEIKAMASNITWDTYFDTLNNLTSGKSTIKSGKINVRTPSYFQALSGLIAESQLNDWKSYLMWQLVYHNAQLLSSPFREESSNWSSILSQRKQAPPRWKQCVGATQSMLGFVIGHHFVQSQFPNGSKEAALEMVHNIIHTFDESITKLEWMDEETKENARTKLRKITNKIGYPDKWPLYENAHVQPNKFFDSVVSLQNAEFAKALLEIGKPVDKSEWYMYPQEVNAYYSSLTNEIVFPAGILANPVFSLSNINAMNYGGIGMVIGHEITHGFDDHGSKYDGDGRMAQWWSNSTLASFVDRASCVSKFYSNYEPLPGLHVNGNLTNGENIADMGGLKSAYRAFQSAKAQEKETRKITDQIIREAFDGLTNDQLFFVSFAQIWCGKSTDAQMRISVTTDPHSPYEYRVNGPVSNSPDFAAAFSCRKGTPMNPEHKCSVW